MRESTQDIAPAMRSATRDAVKIAHSMIDDAETAARAELKAKDYTLCHYCQRGLINFLIATPDATHEATQAEMETLWETCGACSEEYHAHLDRQAREWQERHSCGDAEELNKAAPHLRFEMNGGVK